MGTTKTISAKDSKSFGHQIAAYIDSKDQSRGKKKKPEKAKGEGKTLMDKVRDAAASASKKVGGKGEDNNKDDPAFWPLIKQVSVRCNAHALSTGAILVDLPGTTSHIGM